MREIMPNGGTPTTRPLLPVETMLVEHRSATRQHLRSNGNHTHGCSGRRNTLMSSCLSIYTSDGRQVLSKYCTINGPPHLLPTQSGASCMSLPNHLEGNTVGTCWSRSGRVCFTLDSFLGSATARSAAIKTSEVKLQTGTSRAQGGKEEREIWTDQRSHKVVIKPDAVRRSAVG